MANATTKVSSATVRWGDDTIKRGAVATAQTWYTGAMVARNAGGFSVKGDDTAGNVFDGILADSGSGIVVFSGGSDGDQLLVIERPWRFAMAIASASPGDEGKKVYAVDDQHVGYSSVNSILVGWVDQVLSPTSVLVIPIYSPLNPVAVSNNVLAFSGATGVDQITFPTNLADALSFAQGSNIYLTFTSTSGSEATAIKAPAATAVTNAGGAVTVTAGSGGTTSGTGGAITETAGAGGAGASVGTGGAFSAAGGASTGSGAGGSASLIGGAGGLVSTGGAALVTGGAGGATSGNGGAVTITGGAGTGTSGIGGVAGMTGGAGVGASAGGVGKVVGGVGGTTGAGGAAQVTGGAGGATSGTGGAATVTAGAAGVATAAGGVASIVGGAGLTSGNGGAVLMTGGLAGTTGTGGAATIAGGAGGATSGTGGAASVTGGAGVGTSGVGGAASVTGGASPGASGTAGAASLDAGAKTGGTGATVNIGDVNCIGTYLNRGPLSGLVTGLGLTALGTVQSSTPTIAQLLGGVITQSGTSAGGTVTLPTGTAISAGMPRTPVVGDSFTCYLASTTGGQILTLTGQTGSTVLGTAAVPIGRVAEMIFINTGSNAWSVLCIIGA